MPTEVSYPGVYIEEIPSGVRTITGVSTSITAFAGWTPKGPDQSAQLVLSWGDFDRTYGGLDPRSLLGYAVYHFFTNGGQKAYIVRLTGEGSKSASVTLDGKLTITAKGPGVWANAYGVKVKQRPGTGRFRLTLTDDKNVPIQSFENMSMDRTDRRFVEAVLKDDNESPLISAAVVGNDTDPPADADVKLDGGVDGPVLLPNDPAFETKLLPEDQVGGVYLLDRIDLFNLLCVPGETTVEKISELQSFCRERRSFLIVDCEETATLKTLQNGPNGLTGDGAINAAFYFPWINAPDPQQQNRPRAFPPCGFVAGIYARTDAGPGVWKAPAGTDASLTGVTGITVPLTDKENGVLNPQAINCIRTFDIYGTVVWGARTLQGDDERGSEWKYIPVRRITLFIEESLYRGTKWVVFQPNDEPLWAQIRLNVGAFMHDLFRKGAFQGKTPADAYFVKCDKETTTQNDINRGIVNIVVGFAPLKPAEFVIIKIQQMAGEIQT
jgi:phage tail sheath protein FI